MSIKHLTALIFVLLCSAPCRASTFFVRGDGGSAARCTGLANAPDPGSGSAQACAWSSPQTAFNAATGGDVVSIRANDSFTGNFAIPNYGAGTSYVTVQTTGTIPASGTRITPAFSAQMPKLVSGNTLPTMTFDTGAHHYRFIGIEVTSVGGSVVTQSLIDLSGSFIDYHRCWVHEATNDTSTPDSSTTTAIRGFNAIATDGEIKDSRIAGFRTYQPTPVGVESSQAILFGGNAARYTVENCYLEAWFTPIFMQPSGSSANSATISGVSYDTGTHIGSATFSSVTNLAVDDLVSFQTTGGLTPATNPAHPSEASPSQVAKVTNIAGSVVTFIGWGSFDGNILSGNPLLQSPDTPGLALWDGFVATDINIIRNQFVLALIPTEAVWVATGGSPTVGTTRASQGSFGNAPKGYFEIKSGRNVLIDGNTFEGWTNGFVLTSRNQGNALIGANNPWSGLFNITISNNWFKKNLNWDRVNGFPFGGPQLEDNEYSSVRSGPVALTNNLIESGVENFMSSMGAADNVTVSHNTYPGFLAPVAGSMILGQGANSPGFVFKDNILPNNNNGLNCQASVNCWPGVTASLGSGVTIGSEFKNNVIVDNRTAEIKAGDGPLTGRYPNDQIEADETEVVIKFVSPLTHNYRLASDSPYKNDASDGTDPGVNWTNLVNALGFDPSGVQGTGSVTVSGKVNGGGAIKIQ